MIFRKKTFLNCLLLSCCFLLANSAFAKSKSRIFLDSPSETTYTQLISCDDCFASQCEFTELLSLVRSGNEWAIKLAFHQIPNKDGGELGDLFRALGVSLEAKPVVFFGTLDELNLDERLLQNLLLMLPLDTVDDPAGKHGVLKRRLGIIRDRIPRSDYKDMAMRILEEHAQQIIQQIESR